MLPQTRRSNADVLHHVDSKILLRSRASALRWRNKGAGVGGLLARRPNLDADDLEWWFVFVRELPALSANRRAVPVGWDVNETAALSGFVALFAPDGPLENVLLPVVGNQESNEDVLVLFLRAGDGIEYLRSAT